MTKEADILNKYGPFWSASALLLQALVERPKFMEAGSDFKSFRLVIAVIPIKHMYLEPLRKTFTGQ